MLDLENTVSKAVAYIEYSYRGLGEDLEQYKIDHGYTDSETIKQFYFCLVCYKELNKIGLTDSQIIGLNNLSC